MLIRLSVLVEMILLVHAVMQRAVGGFQCQAHAPVCPFLGASPYRVQVGHGAGVAFPVSGEVAWVFEPASRIFTPISRSF